MPLSRAAKYWLSLLSARGLSDELRERYLTRAAFYMVYPVEYLET